MVAGSGSNATAWRRKPTVRFDSDGSGSAGQARGGLRRRRRNAQRGSERGGTVPGMCGRFVVGVVAGAAGRALRRRRGGRRRRRGRTTTWRPGRSSRWCGSGGGEHPHRVLSPAALGPRAVVGQGPRDRRPPDQRPGREPDEQAGVPARVRAAALHRARPTASTSGRRSSRAGPPSGVREAALLRAPPRRRADGVRRALGGLEGPRRAATGRRRRRRGLAAHVHDRDDPGQRPARAAPRPDAGDAAGVRRGTCGSTATCATSTGCSRCSCPRPTTGSTCTR